LTRNRVDRVDLQAQVFDEVADRIDHVEALGLLRITTGGREQQQRRAGHAVATEGDLATAEGRRLPGDLVLAHSSTAYGRNVDGNLRNETEWILGLGLVTRRFQIVDGLQHDRVELGRELVDFMRREYVLHLLPDRVQTAITAEPGIGSLFERPHMLLAEGLKL